MHRIIYRFIGCLAVVFTTACNAASAETIVVENAWARPGNAGGLSAVYFTVNNPTQETDLLVNLATSVSMHTQLHVSRINPDGTVIMDSFATLEVPAGGSVRLEPGGLHVMLDGLQQDLKVGESFDLILTFQNQGDLIVPVEIKEEG